jgi:signal transduction histidine kinase
MLEERQARFAAIGEVCSTVAHGIRNPLAGISAAAQVARETAGEGPLTQSLSDIVEESRRLEERARRLLDFSSPLQPHFEDCDVRNLVPPVAHALQARSDGSGVTVEMKLPSEAMRVVADPHMITEVLYELGGNALRAMPGGGRLLLEGRVEGSQIVLEIADTGCGIPEGVRGRIFELFFTTRSDGNGMGLAHAKKMIELQGGRISLDWTGAEGTAFRIDLPRAL